MITDNTLLVFVIIGALALLAVIQITLAIRQDRLISAAGPIEELAVYDKRLEEKQRLMEDLEVEVQKRREAMAHVTDVEAEVDGLRRQKEELLTEWNSLEEKRNEVRAVRGEIEDAVIERQSIEAELVPLRAEYLSIKERLEKAEELEGRVESLTAQYEEMAGKIAEKRDELQRLEEAELRVEKLETRERELEKECSRVQGRLEAQNEELEEFAARIAKEREVLAEAQSKHSQAQAEAAAVALELRRQQGEIDALGETRGKLEARLAYLKGEIAKAEGRAPDEDGNATDKLRELRETPPVIRQLSEWKLADWEEEKTALLRVGQRLEAKGLYYPSRTLRAFHTAMKVNETTQMAVLAGISGTGKSQLPRQYSAGMGIGFLQVPVQPRWDSPQDLMGFYNYIEGKFRPTDMARALWALDEENNEEEAIKDRMMMILLDEMNLARVEYYFSDFLSRLESRPGPEHVSNKNERKDAEIELEIPNMLQPPRIFPGYNLLFAGTMNEDESTQSLSDKVVDRANILRFAAPKTIRTVQPNGKVPEIRALSRQRWQNWVRPVSSVSEDQRVTGGVDRMVDLMKQFKRPFGHRLGRAIMAYVANYPKFDGSDPINEALADQIEMRLLPKLRGVDAEAADAPFRELLNYVEQELGDAKLGEAIRTSMAASEETGQFVWSGVTR